MSTDIAKNYAYVIQNLKDKIRKARLHATYSVNMQMLAIYWEIGQTILEQEKVDGWGSKVVDTLAGDLKSEFPEVKGFSPRNLRYMRDFALAYPNLNNDNPSLEDEHINVTVILQTDLAKLSWHHHTTLLDKVKEKEERNFYIQQTTINGWSRDVMVHQIESKLYRRQGKISSNFKETITSGQSELVQQVFKDPYKFDFIYLGSEAKERDIEDALTTHVTKLLLELGQWFSFMGRQYKILLGENEYFFDLLFYHTRLKRYIIIELKIDEFKVEYKGKMDFYLSLADEQLKSEGDEPSIGLILCKTKDGLVAEYALRDSKKPIGIAEYNIGELLPENIKGELPSIEDLEAELDRQYEELKSPSLKRLDNLKEKIAKIKGEEIKTEATVEILFDIIDKSLVPLYTTIINRLEELKDFFYSTHYQWQTTGKQISDINQLSVEWKNEDFVKNRYDFPFHYWLQGFIKGGTESYSYRTSLNFKVDTYSYGFVFNGSHEFILKKVYPEQLTKDEIDGIAEMVFNKVMDEIDRWVEYLNTRTNE